MFPVHRPTWTSWRGVLLTVQCVHIPNRGFRRGSYRCVCPSSRLRPSNSGPTPMSNQSGLDGVELEKAYVEKLLSGGFGPPVSCPSCERVCSDAFCTHESACMTEYDPLLRGIPLGVQSLCITVTIILTFVIIRLRKTKVVRPAPCVLRILRPWSHVKENICKTFLRKCFSVLFYM